jgi:hypothetical protein
VKSRTKKYPIIAEGVLVRNVVSFKYFVILLLTIQIVRAETPAARPPDFAPGQVWSIKSSLPTNAKVVIGRVEAWRNNVAVHVSVIDVQIPQDLAGAGHTATVGHLPFEETALAASLDQLLATGASTTPDFERGYQQWKSDNGGIFTIGVAEVVRLVFETASKSNAK